MTDSPEENEQAFNDIVDPHQARHGRREALTFAINLVAKTAYPTAEDLIYTADAIDKYLNDGTLPVDEE